MESVRLPRFSRAEEIRSFRITDRDLEIIRHVNRHRFLRSSHLVKLLPGSSQQLLRRLQLLFHHGYLERPRAQLDYFHRAGPEPIAYGLGNKGAELVMRESGGDSAMLNWSWKNQSVGRLFLEHALLVSDVMVAFELAAHDRGDVRFLSADQLFPNRNQHSLQWRVTLDNRQKLGVVPDAVFALETTSEDGAPLRAYYFLEADRGTMPIMRQDLRQTSFFRKLLAYRATWKQGLHKTLFGFPRFRVLTVTSSAGRMRDLVVACAKLEAGHGLFIFTESKRFLESNPLSFRWKTCHGESSVLDAVNR